MNTESGAKGIRSFLRRHKWSSNLTEAHVDASGPVENLRYRLRLLQVAANARKRLTAEEVHRRAELFNRARSPRIKLEIIETGAVWIRSARDLEWWEIWAGRADRADARADQKRENGRADSRKTPVACPRNSVRQPA